MKILSCSAEVAPFAKTGGLGDVCGALPIALEHHNIEVVVTLPGYKTIDRKKYGFKKIDAELSVATIGKKTKVYLIENKAFFGRDGIYGDRRGGFEDNLERFRYFSRRSLELLQDIDFKADIVHCHDWHTALIPAFLKHLYHGDPFYKKMKSVLTIHNLAYQGVFPEWDYFKLGLSENLFSIDGFEFYGDVNLLKGGIIFADRVTTVSPNYAKEITTHELGCGLEGVLGSKKPHVTGILNGLDYAIWNPETDTSLAKKYSSKNPQLKAVNKKKLQQRLKLKSEEGIPLFGFVARLTEQKGLDLIAASIQEIMRKDVQLVFLGTGEDKYLALLKGLARRYPGKIGIAIDHDEPMAHLIYAGSDLFLIPSVFEPCGLSQMISLRYGTVPLVYKTGGLADTIRPFNSSDGRGNGFIFDHYTKAAFVSAFKTAVATFHNKKVFEALVKKAFTCNFSWDESAKKYRTLFEQCVS